MIGSNLLDGRTCSGLGHKSTGFLSRNFKLVMLHVKLKRVKGMRAWMGGGSGIHYSLKI